MRQDPDREPASASEDGTESAVGRAATVRASGRVSARRAGRLGMGALMVANVVSVAGGLVSAVALPWFVLATTGSSAATGAAAACEIFPLVAVASVAGWFVDHLGAWMTRVGSDVVSTATVLAIPVLHASAGLAYWQLLVLVALNGAVRAPAPAASLVLLRALAEAAGTAAPRTRSAYSASVQIAAVAGAPLGGVVIAVAGASTGLVIDAASFALSALVLAVAHHAAPVPAPQPGTNAPDPRRGAAEGPTRVEGPPSPARTRRVLPRRQRQETPAPQGRGALDHRSAWGGLSVLGSDRLLAGALLVLVLVDALNGAWTGVLAPTYGRRVLHDPALLGVLFGAFSAGVLAGNLTHPAVAARVRWQVLVPAGLAISCPLRYAVLTAQPAPAVLVAALAIAGAAAGALGPLWLALVTDRVPEHLQGHVFGVTFAADQAANATGALLCGLALARTSLHTGLLTCATLGGVIVLAVLAAIRPRRHQRGPLPPTA